MERHQRFCFGRANHIVAACGEGREALAKKFLRLMSLGYDYNEAIAFQMQKDIAGDASKIPPLDQPIVAAIMPHLNNIDTSNVKALEEEYKNLRRDWTYEKVVERKKQNDPASQKRSEWQEVQPGLYLSYLTCCAFVHADPAALKLEQTLTPLDVVYPAVTAVVSAVNSFFVALGKGQDEDLLRIKNALIEFPVAQKTLANMGVSLTDLQRTGKHEEMP